MAGSRKHPGSDLLLSPPAGSPLLLGRKTTQELVREVLREAILSGRVREGAHLVQDRIATQLGVSRIPVREALLQLEAEGFVRIEAHRGASVIYHSPEDIEELCEIRGTLLASAVRMAVPHLTDAQVAKLEETSRRQDTERSMAHRRRLNRAFYATLFANLERPRLLALIEKLERQVERYLMPIQRPHLGHEKLVEACRRREADRAAQIAYEHVTEVGRRAAERVREMGVEAWLRENQEHIRRGSASGTHDLDRSARAG
jgi:DNA-binding GntR family transcriptional regulator